MKLRDLSIGQKFRFINGSSKIYEKISDCGNVLEYNICRCISDLYPEQKSGLMLISGSNDKRMNKDADVVTL